MVIEHISAEAREEVRVLLAANDLPTDDIDDPSVQLFVARDHGALLGVVGLQRCDTVGLLRSLAVSSASRTRGIGSQLCSHVLDVASREGLSPIYLLTTSASGYFTRHGFVAIGRAEAPPAVRTTAQFASLCPTSAIVMRRTP
jgi:amino-acid N-acetyltransferase